MFSDNPKRTAPSGNLPGVAPGFGDLVDYVPRSTRRIWEDKQVELLVRRGEDWLLCNQLAVLAQIMPPGHQTGQRVGETLNV